MDKKHNDKKITEYQAILEKDIDILINELRSTVEGNGWYELMKTDLAEYLVEMDGEKRTYISSNNHRIPLSSNNDFQFESKFSSKGEKLAGWKQASITELQRKRITKDFKEAFHVQIDTTNKEILLNIKDYLSSSGPGRRIELKGNTKDIFEYVDEKQKQIMFRAKLPLILNGYAGTGKTVVLQQLALRSILNDKSSGIFLSQNYDVVKTAKNFFVDNGIRNQVEAFTFEDIDQFLVEYEFSEIIENINMSSKESRNKYLNEHLFSLESKTIENLDKLFKLKTAKFMGNYFKTKNLDLKEYTSIYVDEAPSMTNYSFFDKITDVNDFCLAYDKYQHSSLDIEKILKKFKTNNFDSINIVHRTTKQIFALAAKQISLNLEKIEFANDDEYSVVINQRPENDVVFVLSEMDKFIDEIIGWESDIINVFADIESSNIKNKNHLYILFTRAKYKLNIFGPFAKEYENV